MQSENNSDCVARSLMKCMEISDIHVFRLDVLGFTQAWDGLIKSLKKKNINSYADNTWKKIPVINLELLDTD